jgi:hypothetical protein
LKFKRVVRGSYLCATDRGSWQHERLTETLPIPPAPDLRARWQKHGVNTARNTSEDVLGRGRHADCHGFEERNSLWLGDDTFISACSKNKRRVSHRVYDIKVGKGQLGRLRRSKRFPRKYPSDVFSARKGKSSIDNPGSRLAVTSTASAEAVPSGCALLKFHPCQLILTRYLGW